MAPPNSMPRLLDTKKYSPPTPTWIFVAIAEALNPVIKVIELASRIIAMVIPRPTLPTTHPNLRYIIKPRIVRRLGVNTPSKVPNFLTFLVIHLELKEIINHMIKNTVI